MSVFRCGRFPSGTAYVRTAAGIVEFTDGKAYVDDPAVAEALREVPGSFRITEEQAPQGEPDSAALREQLAAAQARIVELEAALEAVNDQLREAGIEHPLGAAGVNDLAAMAAGAAEELQTVTAERDALKAAAEAKPKAGSKKPQAGE